MLILTETTDNIQVVLSGAVTTNQLECFSSWRDITTTTYLPGRTVVNTNSVTDVNVVPSPGASTQRVVDYLSVYNDDTVPATVIIKFDANGTEYILWKGTLLSGQSISYQDGSNWSLSANGNSILYNQSVSVQGAGFAADTYVAGSSILMNNPSVQLKAGSRFYMMMNIVKTAAGTATPIVYLRFGTNGTTGDTALCTFTFTAGTAAIDDGILEVWGTFRTVGSGTNAVLQGLARITHRLSVTGIIGTAATSETEIATSAGFNSTVANSIIGVSVNGGASAVWTVSMVRAEINNIV